MHFVELEQLVNEVLDFAIENRQHITELSKATLGSYLKKSVSSKSSNELDASELDSVVRENPKDLDSKKQRDQHDRTAYKRQVGIDKAVNKLTKEDTLDELSTDKMNDYTDTAYKARQKSFTNGGSKVTQAKREKGIQLASRLLSKKKEMMEDDTK